MSNCNSDSDWSCDEEEIEDEPCKCLICDFAAPFPRLEEHLKEVHGDSLVKRCKDLKVEHRFTFFSFFFSPLSPLSRFYKAVPCLYLHCQSFCFAAF